MLLRNNVNSIILGFLAARTHPRLQYAIRSTAEWKRILISRWKGTKTLKWQNESINSRCTSEQFLLFLFVTFIYMALFCNSGPWESRLSYLFTATEYENGSTVQHGLIRDTRGKKICVLEWDWETLPALLNGNDVVRFCQKDVIGNVNDMFTGNDFSSPITVTSFQCTCHISPAAHNCGKIK